MRLEAQLGLWIMDLEQPKTDILKGQDTLLSLLMTTPIQKTHLSLLQIWFQTFSSHLCLSQLTLCNAAVDGLQKTEIQDQVCIVNVVKTLPSIFISKDPHINEGCSP